MKLIYKKRLLKINKINYLKRFNKDQNKYKQYDAKMINYKILSRKMRNCH